MTSAEPEITPPSPQELRRDDVPPAAGGERLDDLGVAPRDDEDGEHRGRRDEEGKDGVPPRARYASSGRTRRRRSGRRPAHPGEEGDQGDVVEDLRSNRSRGAPSRSLLMR